MVSPPKLAGTAIGYALLIISTTHNPDELEPKVLSLLAQGLTNSAIAGRLVLSPKTVRNHVSNIFSKLQVADRAQAIIRAREAGLGDQASGNR